MILDILHLYQATGHTCAPTVMRMVLAGLGLDFPTEEEMSKLMETDSVTGTKYQDLLKIGESFGLEVKDGTEGTIDQLDEMIKEGWMIIIGYHYFVPHASIYLGSDDKHIYLHDPDQGPKTKMTKERFMRDWEVNPARFSSYLSEHRIDWPEDQTTDQWWSAYRIKQ